jgi:NAD(P)-dependent dehydrogenase (short-subunit alcohol dehydrogenase family)
LKTILITGTTNGIGRITAMELAKAGHTIVMANRNRVKSEQTQAEIIAQTGNDNIELLDLDLSSLDSVRACAEAFKTSHNTLDILINNAGLTSQTELLSKDGYELQFAVNALAQLEFTLELLPVLESAAPSQVIFVTSMMHKFGKLNFNSFEGWKKYSGEDRKIAVNTLHPGAVNTGILDGYSKTVQFFLRKLFISVEKGAKTSLFLACQESKSLPTGRYFVNCKEASAHKLLANTVMREKLWDQCCEYLNRTSAP